MICPKRKLVKFWKEFQQILIQMIVYKHIQYPPTLCLHSYMHSHSSIIRVQIRVDMAVEKNLKKISTIFNENLPIFNFIKSNFVSEHFSEIKQRLRTPFLCTEGMQKLTKILIWKSNKNFNQNVSPFWSLWIERIRRKVWFVDHRC